MISSNLEKILHEERIKSKAPAIGISISVQGKHTHHIDGNADIDQESPFSENIQFQIGNLTEIFTSILTHELISKGLMHETIIHDEDEIRRKTISKRLSLNSAIEKILDIEIKEPEFNMKFISIQNLLSHTSGIGEYVQARDFYKEEHPFYIKNGSTKPNYKELYSSKIEQMFTAKSQWFPSDHNYGLIGFGLEEITGG